MTTIKNIVDIDFYVDALDDGSQYWLVLEDNHANNDNYHRFRFNIDNNAGSLLINNNYCYILYSEKFWKVLKSKTCICRILTTTDIVFISYVQLFT